jgi:hypothetical protein
LTSLLSNSCELSGDDIGRVRVKERHTFVGVPTERVDFVISSLQGTQSRIGPCTWSEHAHDPSKARAPEARGRTLTSLACLGLALGAGCKKRETADLTATQGIGNTMVAPAAPPPAPAPKAPQPAEQAIYDFERKGIPTDPGALTVADSDRHSPQSVPASPKRPGATSPPSSRAPSRQPRAAQTSRRSRPSRAAS